MKPLLWLLVVTFVVAVLVSLARAHTLEVWTITLIEIDYDKGTVTMRLKDFDDIVRSHNGREAEIKRLRRMTGCV
jgi:hypothetical protein